MTLHIRPASPDDIPFIGSRMRRADVEEITAAADVTPEEALTMGLLHSLEPLTAVAPNGDPVCMFGVGKTYDPLVGSVWLLGTDAVKENRLSFLRLSKSLTTRFHQDFPVLTNFVDERNTVHIEWLRWLGYRFIFRHPLYGAGRVPFIEFARLQHVPPRRDGGGDVRD
nr:hypothetical protein [Methylobacterium sp. ZNC0032]